MATPASRRAQWSIVDRFEACDRTVIVLQRVADAAPASQRAIDPSQLTHRERQVLGYALEGHSNKVAAFELGIAVSTVAMHLASAASKLGVRRRVDLVNLCHELGWSGEEL